MAPENILVKIKKLLALATSPNEHEAALAASKASDLLAEHKLSMADVEGASAEHKEAVGEEILPTGKRNFIAWQDWLISTVSRCFHCKPIRRIGGGYTIIGKPTDVATAIATYNWLVIQVKRLTAAQRTLHGKRAHFSFACGVTTTINSRLRDAFVKRKNENPKYGALVVIDDHAVATYVATKYPRLSTTRSASRSYDHEAYQAGREAGHSVSLGHKGIGGGRALIR